MTSYTFRINGADFSALVHRQGYQTDRQPVVSWNMTDLTGTEHRVVSKWRHVLTVQLNPMTRAQAQALCAELVKSTVSVTFSSLQTGEDVTASMWTDTMPLQHQLRARGKDWLRGFELTLTEL